MKNWKTTVFGLLAALPYILSFFGIEIPADVANALTGGGVVGIGVTAKDFNITNSPNPVKSQDANP